MSITVRELAPRHGLDGAAEPSRALWWWLALLWPLRFF